MMTGSAGAYIPTLVRRLHERARIRREIPHRKAAVEGKPDRLADLLDEAGNALGDLYALSTIDAPLEDVLRQALISAFLSGGDCAFTAYQLQVNQDGKQLDVSAEADLVAARALPNVIAALKPHLREA